MDAKDIKQRLDQVDVTLAAKLAELGFTPEEIERQLDPHVPEAVKAAEREAALGRKFAAELNDPSSGLMDRVIAQVSASAEKEIARLEAEAAARRNRRLIQLGVALVLAGVAVWYFVLRDARSGCEKLVGPLAELERVTGKALKKGYSYRGKYSCTQAVEETTKVGTVLQVETQTTGDVDSAARSEKEHAYVDRAIFSTAKGDTYLFIAGDAKGPSAEELQREAEKRVGRSRDPIGDVLSGLPPSQHVVLMRDGEGGVIKINLAREYFTAEAAKAYAIAVAERAK